MLHQIIDLNYFLPTKLQNYKLPYKTISFFKAFLQRFETKMLD